MSLLSNITCSVMLASSLTLFAGRPAGLPSEVDDQKILRWMNWWMDEACRQTVPLPQLLFVCDMSLETDVEKMEDMDGRLNATGRITDLHSYAYGYQHEWHRDNAGWIATEAFVLPSATTHVYAEAMGAFLVMLPFDGDLPALCLQPPQEYASAFFWLKKIRVPETIHSAVFNACSFAGVDPLTLNIPKQFLGHAEEWAYLLKHAGGWAYPFMPAPYDHCE